MPSPIVPCPIFLREDGLSALVRMKKKKERKKERKRDEKRKRQRE